MKRKTKLFIAFSFIFVLLVAGISYALFNANLIGEKLLSVEVNGIVFKYRETGNAISLTDTNVMTDIEGKEQNDYFDFNIYTEGEEPIDYNIYLTLDSENTLDSTYVKCYLTDQSDNEVVFPTTISDLLVYSNVDNSFVLYSDTITPDALTGNNTQYYRLRVWVDKEVESSGSNISINDGKQTAILDDYSFKFKVNVSNETYENRAVVSNLTATPSTNRSLKVGDTVSFAVTFDKEVSGELPSLKMNLGETTSSKTLTGTLVENTITYVYTVDINDNGTIMVEGLVGGNLKDALGNKADLHVYELFDDIIVNTSTPTIIRARITSPNNGSYGIGQVVTITFDLNKEVTGTIPSLILKAGDNLVMGTPTGVLGEKEIVYNYTIESGDNGTLTIFGLSGGTLEDAYGDALSLVLPIQSGDSIISDQSGNIVVADTSDPEIESIGVTSPSTGTYKVGQEVTILMAINENITGTAPALSIKFGVGTNKLISTGTVNDDTITYSYTISSGDTGVLTINSLTGGSIEDSLGNPLTIEMPITTGNTITADTTGPIITKIEVTNPLTGKYKAGQNINIVATFNENVTGTAPNISLNFNNISAKGTATSVVSGNTVTYSYPITGGGTNTYNVTYYRTRTQNPVTYTNWSAYTTIPCDTSNSNLCLSRTTYSRATYGNWGDYTTTSCTESDTCQVFDSIYRTRTATAVAGRYTNNYCPASTYSSFQDKSNEGRMCYWQRWKKTCELTKIGYDGCDGGTVTYSTTENTICSGSVSTVCYIGYDGYPDVIANYTYDSDNSEWDKKSGYTTCSGVDCCASTLTENGNTYVFESSRVIYKCYNYSAWSAYAEGTCSSPASCVNGYGSCCEDDPGYKTREKIWSDYTTTSCGTINNTCASRIEYSYREENPTSYSNWSSWTTTSCGIESDTCEHKIEQETNETLGDNGALTIHSLSGTLLTDAVGNRANLALPSQDSLPPNVGENITADTVLPSCAIAISGNSASKNLTISSTDDDLHTTPYSWDDGVEWTATSTKTVYANGNYTATVRDEVGNTGTCTATVTGIDTQAPVCTWSTPNAYMKSGTSQQLVLTCTDNVGITSGAISDANMNNALLKTTGFTTSTTRTGDEQEYVYTIDSTVTAGEYGTKTLTLPAGAISDAAGNSNVIATTSPTVGVYVTYTNIIASGRNGNGWRWLYDFQSYSVSATGSTTITFNGNIYTTTSYARYDQYHRVCLTTTIGADTAAPNCTSAICAVGAAEVTYGYINSDGNYDNRYWAKRTSSTSKITNVISNTVEASTLAAGETPFSMCSYSTSSDYRNTLSAAHVWVYR